MSGLSVADSPIPVKYCGHVADQIDWAHGSNAQTDESRPDMAAIRFARLKRFANLQQTIQETEKCDPTG
jgi:hypothetical protein